MSHVVIKYFVSKKPAYFSGVGPHGEDLFSPQRSNAREIMYEGDAVAIASRIGGEVKPRSFCK